MEYTAGAGRNYALKNGSATQRTRLMRAIESMLKLEADMDGWRTGAYEGKTLWLTPNEVGGLTLMFPEDW